MQAVSLCSPKIYEVQSWHLIEQNQFFAIDEKELESLRRSLSPGLAGYARPAQPRAGVRVRSPIYPEIKDTVAKSQDNVLI